MKTKGRTAERASARDRLLAAAGELFYSEGVNSVGIDRVIEKAGVAKASLYSNFENKDDLIRAYLLQRHETRRLRTERWLAKVADPKAKILAIFDALGERIQLPDFHGCAFIRASAEMNPDSPARDVCIDSRAWLRALFEGLAYDAGFKDPSGTAANLVLLYDGAVVSAQLDKNLKAAAIARRAAQQLLNSANVRRR